MHRRDALMERRCRSQRRRRHRNRFGVHLLLENRFNPKQKAPVNRRCEIELPERLDLEENYEVTVTHLSNVRNAAQRRVRLRYLNFDSVRYISPSAALLLASEVDHWNETVGLRVRSHDESWDPNVRRLLCEMGFFELLHLARPAVVSEVINTTFLPFVRGSVSNKQKGGQLAKELRQTIERVAGIEIRKHLLFDGLTEAITNVSQHAYAKSRKKGSPRYWWMSGAFVKDTNTVIVGFCDHGLTIPGTLPASKIFEKMRDQFALWNDGQRIRAAMEYGRSSTRLPGRGQGLQNFLEVINGHINSQLRIYSNRGLLTVTNSGQNGLSFDSSVKEVTFRGTLIEWQFVPKKATDENLNS